MAKTVNFEELKTTVVQSLETSGLLSQIRAQLRANVFKAIERHDDLPRQVRKLGDGSPRAAISTELVADFFEFHGLHHSLSVFQVEAQMCSSSSETPTRRRRDELAQEVAVGPPGNESSLLEQLIDSRRSATAEQKMELQVPLEKRSELWHPSAAQVDQHNEFPKAPSDALSDKLAAAVAAVDENEGSSTVRAVPSSPSTPLVAPLDGPPGPVHASPPLSFANPGPIASIVPATQPPSALGNTASSPAVSGSAALTSALRAGLGRGRKSPLGTQQRQRLPPLESELLGFASNQVGLPEESPAGARRAGLSEGEPSPAGARRAGLSEGEPSPAGARRAGLSEGEPSPAGARRLGPAPSATAATKEAATERASIDPGVSASEKSSVEQKARLSESSLQTLRPLSPQGPLPPLFQGSSTGTGTPSEGSLVGVVTRSSLLRGSRDKKSKDKKPPPELNDESSDPQDAASTRTPTPAAGLPTSAPPASTASEPESRKYSELDTAEEEQTTSLASGIDGAEGSTGLQGASDGLTSDEEAFGEVAEDVLLSSASSASSIILGSQDAAKTEQNEAVPRSNFKEVAEASGNSMASVLDSTAGPDFSVDSMELEKCDHHERVA